MDLIRRLLGGPLRETPTVAGKLLTQVRDDAVLHVVGEASYEAALERLAGGRTPDGAANTLHMAALIREPRNRYDENAIAVQVEGRTVGYLSRQDAIRYRAVVEWAAAKGFVIACDARITGGWDRGRRDRGLFGIELHIGSPAETFVELLEDELAVRTDHPWAGWMIAFTGESRYAISGVPLDQEGSALLARRAGMSVHPRVTKQVRLLVDCDPHGQSGNELKALGYGITVITEGEFWTALGLPVEAHNLWGRRPEWQRR